MRFKRKGERLIAIADGSSALKKAISELLTQDVVVTHLKIEALEEVKDESK